MNTLTITEGEDGSQILSMQIPPIEPLLAVPAILAALATLPQPKPPRKKRADAGTSRKPDEPIYKGGA